MQTTSHKRGWSSVKPPKKQQGQALIYGFFVLMGGLAALFFLFNTGQLSAEKTKLVNTADAVAYSAGVMHARALNFDAYTNRAMLANTVAIAQLVSLSSWIQYENNLATFGATTLNPKFALFYPSYYAAVAGGPSSNTLLIVPGTLEKLAQASDKVNQELQLAQRAIYLGMLPARKQVMDQVVAANYQNDGSVLLDMWPLTGNEFAAFSSQYSGNDRTRFREIALKSANADKFVPKRSWDLVGFWGDCNFIKPDFLTRRGGTELLGFDEWKAVDVLSEHRWIPANKFDIFCSGLTEVPDGWGGQSAANGSATMVDTDPGHYDNAIVLDPASTGLAMVTSSSWGYSGIPTFFDLSDAELKNEKGDPRMTFAIRLRRNVNQTMTSEGRSAIKQSSSPSHTLGLNDYHALPAGGNEMVAVGASEVYFQRPPNQDKNNVYGQKIGKPNEIGSLFNPYWQVHLIGSDSAVRQAQAMQGVEMSGVTP